MTALSLGYFNLLNGATCVLAPGLFTSGWGRNISELVFKTTDKDDTEQVKATISTLGYYLLLLGTLIVAVTDFNLSAHQAIGASSIWAVVMTGATLFCKYKQLESIYLSRVLSWMVPHAVVLSVAFAM